MAQEDDEKRQLRRTLWYQNLGRQLWTEISKRNVFLLDSYNWFELILRLN